MQKFGLLAGIARKYGRAILTGKANIGRCLACDHRTLFVVAGPWLANDYLCVICGSMPRWRGIVHVLDTCFPNWRDVSMHECGAGGLSTEKFRRESTQGYSGSRYLVPAVPAGDTIGDRMTCQDIQDLTFPDESFDLFITQDVLEHVLRPDRAIAEIARVLKPGGAHVFTVPIYHGCETIVRVAPSETGMTYLLPADYHGDPDGPEPSLVIREWGDDFVDFVSRHSDLTTESIELHDRKLGLDANPGSPLQVFISRKPTGQ